MQINIITIRNLICTFCLPILIYSCFKGEDPEPFIPPTEIRIDATVPEIVYLNQKLITLDARRTIIMNGKRTLQFKWSCPTYPGNEPPKISHPNEQLTVIDNLRAGIYKLQLAVTDANGNSAVSQFDMEVKSDTLSGPPRMNVLRDTVIYLPQNTITINGANAYSVNPIGRDLFFQWSLIQQPAGSPPINIHSKTNPVTKIDGYVPGSYVFRLEVKNELGLSAADTMEISIVRDSLRATSKIYENLTWERYNDGWDNYYYLLLIRDSGVFMNRTKSNLEVQLWDHERQTWAAPDKYDWYLTPDQIEIFHQDSIHHMDTRAKVTFY